MKHIVWVVLAAAFIFTATAGYSRGFSVGVFGAYSIDGGPIEEIINDARQTDSTTITSNTKYDTKVVSGGGLHIRYEFSNNLFFRTGFEYYELFSGGEISHMNRKYSIEYRSMAWPIMAGINTTPDKGKTYIYGAMGLVLSNPENKFYEELNAGITYRYERTKKTFLPGFGAIAGIEKKLFLKTYITLEYAFYKCDNARKEHSQYYDTNMMTYYDYEYTERYGLPRQQARIGVRYSF